jgi:hypothetical protein
MAITAIFIIILFKQSSNSNYGQITLVISKKKKKETEFKVSNWLISH